MIEPKSNRKGFIFTLLVLVIIVFMIVEIGIYFRTYELRQESEPNKIRSQVITEVASQFSQHKLAETIGVPVYTALYTLNNDSVSNPPAYDNLTDVVWALVWNGTRSDDASGAQKIPEDHTLSVWDSKMKSNVESMGMKLDTSYSNISVAQSDPWTVQLNVTFSVNLTDSVSTATIRASVPLSINTSIIGFEDPLIKRKTSGVIVRNIIPAASSPSTRLISTGSKGRGWFYGEPVVVTTQPDNYSPDNKKLIMVTDHLSTAIAYGNIYGAVVVVSDGSQYGFPEINVPIFFNPSMSISDVPTTPFLILSETDDTVTDTHTVMYDMSAVRNYAQCGLYTTHAGVGYSYLARLTTSSPQIFDPTEDMGIETVIGGKEAWVQYPGRSAVDHSYFATTSGSKVMGLPGCNDMVSCNLTSNSPVKMRLDNAHILNYGLTNMTCTVLRCGS